MKICGHLSTHMLSLRIYLQNDQRWIINNDYGPFGHHFLVCPEIKEGVPLRGAKPTGLHFTVIELSFKILSIYLSLPNKWTNLVKIHELLPYELHPLKTLIFIPFLFEFALTEQGVKLTKNKLTYLVFSFYCPLKPVQVWGANFPLMGCPRSALIFFSLRAKRSFKIPDGISVNSFIRFRLETESGMKNPVPDKPETESNLNPVPAM